jgi:predicted CopG family antitoxin
MTTTIQISDDLQNELTKRKLFERETYEEVIWDVIEDTMELNEETKNEITEARNEFKKGKYYTLEQIEKETGE